MILYQFICITETDLEHVKVSLPIDDLKAEMLHFYQKYFILQGDLPRIIFFK